MICAHAGGVTVKSPLLHLSLSGTEEVKKMLTFVSVCPTEDGLYSILTRDPMRWSKDARKSNEKSDV